MKTAAAITSNPLRRAHLSILILAMVALFSCGCSTPVDEQSPLDAADDGQTLDMSMMDDAMSERPHQFFDMGVDNDLSVRMEDQFLSDAFGVQVDQGAPPVSEPASPGCGQMPEVGSGTTYVEMDAGPEGDGLRRFLLSIPEGYDPDTSHTLIVGFAGRDALGELMQRYLGLERNARPNEIFVYPDPLRRQFQGWGTYGGWLLGPHAQPADGLADLHFTRVMVEYLQARYCIDPDRIFATGHSWGGDMAHVVACFLGDVFRASIPVAANRPYWFEQGRGSWVSCEGDTAVWTFFGIADDAFLDAQSYPGEFGDLVRDFWVRENGCDGLEMSTLIDFGSDSTCTAFEGCDVPVRYCLYGPDTGHQIPPYYSSAAMEWFRSF